MLPILALVTGTVSWLNVDTAQADTTPPAGTPATVSADPLPTVQINGIVKAQVTVGSTVYVTGSFSSARPAGSALGTNETPRGNLLAYDITTGNLITSFNHSLNGFGRAIAASPDGSRLYVGGDFTQVDGTTAPHLVAFDLPSGARATSFTAGFSNGSVRAISATNSSVYVGGTFTTATTGAARTRLAQFTKAGALTSWAPTADRQVMAMVLTPDGTKVVIGGVFSTISGVKYHALGAINATTGAPVAWASQSDTYPIRMDETSDHSSAALGSLSTDGTRIFLTAWNFYSASAPGLFEGRAAISATDGSVIWANDCHGDSYASFPINGVLYSGSHAHDCAPAGSFPEEGAFASHHHYGLAESTMPISAGLTNGPATNGYRSWQGFPRSNVLTWFPAFNAGSVENQSVWSVTGNTSYVSFAGEFTKIGSTQQQGLVRFAVKSIAPNQVGPEAYSTSYPVTAGSASSNGITKVSFPATWDRDNTKLTYTVFRDKGTTPIFTKAVDSQFWNLPQISFFDQITPDNNQHYYRLYVTDGFTTKGPFMNLVDDGSPAVTYGGAWTNDTNRQFGNYNNSAHYTTVNGASATLTFTGTAVSVIAEKDPQYGNMSISIDGGAATTVSTTANPRTNAAKVFTKSGLTNTQHTIKVTKLDNTYLVLDGFHVDGTVFAASDSWYSSPGTQSLLRPGQNASIWSSSGQHSAVFQPDGNLVVYRTGSGAIWSSHTNGKVASDGAFVIQSDGNVVIYSGSPANAAVWFTGTNTGNTDSKMVIQDDGNLALYQAPAGTNNYRATWSSITGKL